MEKELDINVKNNTRKNSSLYSFIQIGYKFFNNILSSTLFVKTETPEEKHIRTTPRKSDPVSIEIDKFINIEMGDEINLLIQKGYLLQPYQLNNYIKLLENRLDKEGIFYLQEIINKKHYIPDEFLTNLIINNKFLSPKIFTNPHLKDIAHYVSNRFNDKNFTDILYQQFLLGFNYHYQQDIKRLNEVVYGTNLFKTVDERVHALTNNHSLFLNNFSNYSSLLSQTLPKQKIIDFLAEITPKTNEFNSLIDKLNQKIDSEYKELFYAKEKIKRHISNVYHSYKTSRVNLEPSKIELDLNKIKSILKNELKTEFEEHLNKLSNIINNPIDLVKNASMKDFNKLPLEASSLLSNLKDDIKYCLENEKFLTDDKKYRVSSLLENDISEIITKYITIHPEYRETLFNQNNRNASQIMIESLSQVSHILKEYIEEINQLKLDDLSANNRKIKML